MCDISEQKRELRAKMLEKRKNMPYKQAQCLSAQICENIIRTSVYEACRTVFCYAAVNNEADLSNLINHALINNKKVAMPKVINNDIYFFYIKSLDDLTPGYFHIPEPEEKYPAKSGELIIVPGVAFSYGGRRIGYGGGFYDRFLSENPIFSIGAAYDFQVSDFIPSEKHDCRIDKIITNDIRQEDKI